MHTRRFLVVSADTALATDLAWQRHREGHDVRHYVEADVDDQWWAAGESEMPLVVTGEGETMQATREQCYDHVDAVVMPNMYYWDDIGERWVDGGGDRLQARGYLGPA